MDVRFDNLRLKGNIAASVATNLGKEMVKIFPNPSNGRIYVSFDKTISYKAADFYVKDLSGKVVYQNLIHRDTELALELADGVYVYEIIQNDGVFHIGRIAIRR